MAGPKSRALLQSLVRDDLSTAAFPFMSFRRMEIGMVPGYVGPRVLHRRSRLRNLGDHGLSARAVRSTRSRPAASIGLKLFGGRALNAMRIEKSFGTWAREYRPIYGPFEAGLGRFVDFKKG